MTWAIRVPVDRRQLRLYPDPRRLGRRGLALLILLGAVLTVGALVGVASAAGWASVWRGLLNPRWVWIAVAPAGIAVSHAGYTLAYREVARTEDGPELAGREAVAMVTSGFGPFSVRGGFAFDESGLGDVGMPRHVARRRVLMLGMLEYVILAPATLGAAAYLRATGWRAQPGVLLSWMIGVPAGTVAAITLLVAYRLSDRSWPAWSPIRRSLDAIDGTLSMLRSWPAGPLSVIGMAALGAAAFACVGIAGVLVSGAFLADVIPTGSFGQLFSGGTVPLLNGAVGVEVASSVMVLLAKFLQQAFLVRRPEDHPG